MVKNSTTVSLPLPWRTIIRNLSNWNLPFTARIIQLTPGGGIKSACAAIQVSSDGQHFAIAAHSPLAPANAIDDFFAGR